MVTMTTKQDEKQPSMMTLGTPDPERLQALGLVSVRHAALEHILRMTVKTLTDVTPEEAMDATAFAPQSQLRRRIIKLARQRLADGNVFVRLQAITAMSWAGECFSQCSCHEVRARAMQFLRVFVCPFGPDFY
jgi:hypothetical protein